jgi:hypothetical protein
MTALHYSRALLLPNVHVLASAILLLLLHSRPPHNLRPANVRVIMCRIKYATLHQAKSQSHALDLYREQYSPIGLTSHDLNLTRHGTSCMYDESMNERLTLTVLRLSQTVGSYQPYKCSCSKRSVATLRIYDCAHTQFLATDDQGINLLAFVCGSCVVR